MLSRARQDGTCGFESRRLEGAEARSQRPSDERKYVHGQILMSGVGNEVAANFQLDIV